MYTTINGNNVKIYVNKKSIKNTYIRVKKDLCIYVTANFFVSDKYILNLIKKNEAGIFKMIELEKKKLEKTTKFYLLGKKYDVVLCNVSNCTEIIDDKVYTKNLSRLNIFYKKYAMEVFKTRLYNCFSLFDDTIPFPKLKIRKMIRKWGYCNKKDKFIMLNLDLIKYNIDEIDYVIIHELCHFIHFDHSKQFWDVVKKYKPNYKKNRKVLREE